MIAASSTMGSTRTGNRWRWRTTVINLLLLGVLVAGIAIWRYVIPFVERTLGTLGATIAATAAGAAEAMNDGIDQAYFAVASDAWVRERLGSPVTFPPLEQIEWTAATRSDEMAFAFTATGSRAEGKIHGRMRFGDRGIEITSLEMSNEQEVRAVLLPLPPLAE